MLVISAILFCMVSFVGKQSPRIVQIFPRRSFDDCFCLLNVAAAIYETSNSDVVLGGDGLMNTLKCNLTLPIVFYMKKKGENITHHTTLGPLNRDFKQVERIEGSVLYFEQDKLSTTTALGLL